MAAPPTIARPVRADWTLMTAIHAALRRDVARLLPPRAGPAAARARWTAFRGQLHRHLAAEQAALWRPARAKLTGDPHGQALLEAMDDEHHLIGPLHAAADDAFAMAAGPGRLHPLLTRLRTKLTSHLAHQETDAPRPPRRWPAPVPPGTCPAPAGPSAARPARPPAAAPPPGPRRAPSRGRSPTPPRPSAPRSWASCPHPPASSTAPSGCPATPAPPRHCDQNPIRPPRQHPRLAPPPRQGIGPWCAVESSGGGITVISGTLRRLPAARGRARRCIRSGQRVSNWVKAR